MAIHQEGAVAQAGAADGLIADLAPGTLTVVRGNGGSGKSALVLGVSCLVGRRDQKHIGWISLELSRQELLSRMLALHTGRESRQWRAGAIAAGDADLRAALAVVGALRFSISDQIDTLERTVEKVRRWHQKQPMDLIVIDYLDMFLESGAGEGIARNQKRIKILQEVVRTLRCAMLVVEQAPDGQRNDVSIEKRRNGQERVEDIADAVWMLERKKGEGIIHVKTRNKQRNTTKELEFRFEEEVTRVVMV